MSNLSTRTIYYEDLELEVPKQCPHCHKEMKPTILAKSNVINQDSKKVFAVLAQCNICSSFYALEFFYNNPKQNPRQVLIPYDYIPDVNLIIPDEIKSVSKDFEEIYTQSETAYQLNLKQIAGMGFRKSIEFLVKDFLIYQNPSDSDRILKLMLNNAISEIDNPKLKNLARMCNYLGNDQVHITTRHPTKDIDDLRNFTKNLVTLITFEINYLDGTQSILSNWFIGSTLPTNSLSL